MFASNIAAHPQLVNLCPKSFKICNGTILQLSRKKPHAIHLECRCSSYQSLPTLSVASNDRAVGNRYWGIFWMCQVSQVHVGHLICNGWWLDKLTFHQPTMDIEPELGVTDPLVLSPGACLFITFVVAPVSSLGMGSAATIASCGDK